MLFLIMSDQFTVSKVLQLADALQYVRVCCRAIAIAATQSQPTDFPIDASFKPVVYFDTSEPGIKR